MSSFSVDLESLKVNNFSFDTKSFTLHPIIIITFINVSFDSSLNNIKLIEDTYLHQLKNPPNPPTQIPMYIP